MKQSLLIAVFSLNGWVDVMVFQTGCVKNDLVHLDLCWVGCL